MTISSTLLSSILVIGLLIMQYLFYQWIDPTPLTIEDLVYNIAALFLIIPLTYIFRSLK